MRIYDVIMKKRNGGTLSDEEIAFFIDGYTAGRIPDYQASALLMAIWFKGMDEHETAVLTDCMARSGDMVDLSAIPGIKVDKHSTGGVGDKTTLIVAPVVAAWRRAGRQDERARAGAHGRHNRQARIDPGLLHLGRAGAVFPDRAGRRALGHRPDGQHRARGQEDLRAARRDGHGGQPAAHRLVDHEQKARGGLRRDCA